MNRSQPGPKIALFRRWLPIPALPASRPDPAASPAEARDRLAALQALDDGIAAATRSKLFEPEHSARATVVIWHGFTNAPSQFGLVAEALAAQGYRVLVPRLPRHGQADVLTRDLANLSVAELTAHADACLDIAAGFGDPVWVIGLSAGGTLAAWAAATRTEVSRLVLAAPLVAPKALPLTVVRLLVRFRHLIPNVYLWWDPRKKANLGNSPYAYPGFPISGILPFLHLSEALFDRSVAVGHQLQRTVLVSNPGDLAIRRDSAAAFATDLFFEVSEVSGVAMVDGSLKWMHDFVDPYSPDAGSTEQVEAIMAACLGVADPSAGGLLVPPLVALQP